jgi:hypothetical protein
MATTGTISGTFNIKDIRTVGTVTNATIPVNWNPSSAFTDGVGALMGNVLYQNTLALSAGVYNFDLAGTLTDGFGTTMSLARVKALGFLNNSSTNTMTLGNHASAAFSTIWGLTGTMIIRPGGWMILTCVDATGYAVTATTADILKIAGTGTDTFSIYILGANA